MKRKSKRTLTPKLRFPEFCGELGWEESTVGALVATVSPPKKLTTSQYFSEGRFPIVDQSPDGQCGWTNDVDALIENSFPLIVFGDHTCVLKLVNQPFAQGADGIKIFRPKRIVSTEYLYHFLSARPLVMESYKRHFSILKCMKVFYPEGQEAEQQKIAECLSSLDGLIAAEGRKLEALKAHKKSLMQQLFPQPGQTQPRLRFPEFRDKGEWTESNLGPMTTKVGSGITPRGGDKNYRKDGRVFVRSQNVGWGVLILDDVSYIDEETHSSFDATEIKINDVLLNITGASIGRSAVSDSSLTGGNVNQHVCIIRTKPSRLHPFLLNQYLISKCGQTQIDSFQAGGNRQGLNFGQIRSFVIPMPPTKAEQERIADCLTVLDTRIAAQASKIETLRQHKRGLMQQLFPAPEESEA